MNINNIQNLLGDTANYLLNHEAKTISKNDIHIVPHGNYTQFINIRKDKTQSRAKLDLPQDKTILLFFGMIKKVKGLEVLP